MKILFYINVLSHGGAERVMSNVATMMSKRGHQCVLATSYPLENEYRLGEDVVRYNLSQYPINNFILRNFSLIFTTIVVKNRRNFKMKQVIGLDIGRGYVKAYSNFNGKEEIAVFNSVYGNGRLNIDYASWKDPIALSIDKDLFFFGELAVKESLNKSTNIKDEKTTEIAEKLLIAALSRIGRTKEIKIMLGVPNRLYNKRNREEVISKYKNKTYKFIPLLSK